MESVLLPICTLQAHGRLPDFACWAIDIQAGGVVPTVQLECYLLETGFKKHHDSGLFRERKNMKTIATGLCFAKISIH